MAVEEKKVKIPERITGKTIKRAAIIRVRIYTKNTVRYNLKVERKFESTNRVESAIDSIKLTP